MWHIGYPPSVRQLLPDVLTGSWHTRASSCIAERTGAHVAIHPADAAHAREQGTHIDAAREVGQRVGLFTVVGVPALIVGDGFPMLEGAISKLRELVGS